MLPMTIIVCHLSKVCRRPSPALSLHAVPEQVYDIGHPITVDRLCRLRWSERIQKWRRVVNEVDTVYIQQCLPP